MERQTLEKFAIFLQNYKKKNRKKLGERTINGILTMAKFIPETQEGAKIEELEIHFRDYLSSKNHPMAKQALSLYLKWLGYEPKMVKEVVKFEKPITAVDDQEKLAESVLSLKEVQKLATQAPELKDRLIIRLLYDTAARVSELCAVKLSDIDFEKGQIQVMGKGRKPREVFFFKETGDTLKQWVKINRLKPDDLVFGITPAAIWIRLKKLGKELLGHDLRPHMFRHSRLQHMADDGIDGLAIKAYAGHENLRTTEIYVKASIHLRRIAFEKSHNPWEGA